MSRYLALHQNRFLNAANAYIHQGPAVQQTHPIKISEQPNLSTYPGRQQLAETADLGQAIIVIQQDVFALPQFSLAAWPRRQQLSEVQPVDGATIQATNPIPGVSLIEMSRYRALESTRTIPGAVIQINQGSAIQQTVPIPGVDRIELSRYSFLNYVRTIPVAVPQFTGATIQRTNPISPIFGQPVQSRYASPQFPAVAAQLIQSAVVTQTDVFSLPQPNLSWWAFPLQRDVISRTISEFIPIATGTIEDRINLGMRIGVNQSDTIMGGFG